MPLYERLIAETAPARERFMAIPILDRALSGGANRSEYLAFLGQAYHHVRHTVPLLMSCGARLPDRLGWLRAAMAAYTDEELGHELWILDDIRAAGGDADAARDTPPSPATELMVAYAYDLIARRNPVGFLGMVFVLESTSVALGSKAANALREGLRLPATALRYLTSHGDIDQEHMVFYQTLVDRLEETDDQAIVIHSAKMFYRLYGAIFESLAPAEDINDARNTPCTH